MESGGNYDAVGKPNDKGQRAYGKFQVFETNLPSWTKEALGREYTPDEFLADPQAQEKVADHFMGQSLQKYGNPDDVASVWFTGRPVEKAGLDVQDYTGTSNAAYLDKFRQGMGQPSQRLYTPLAQRQSPMDFPKTNEEAEKQLNPFVKNATTLAREVARPIADPESIITPTLEAAGVPHGLAAAAGMAGGMISPGGKGKSAGSLVEKLSNMAKNSLFKNKSGVREKSLQYFRENPQEITKEPIRIREVDGQLVVEDGRHRLEAARELGIDNIKVIDTTPDYPLKEGEVGQASKLLQELTGTPVVDKTPIYKVKPKQPRDEKTQQYRPYDEEK